MHTVELIPFIRETLEEYKLMINVQLLHTLADPDGTLAQAKAEVGKMSGAEGFAMSLIELLTEDDNNE
jgi:hypothetical protein